MEVIRKYMDANSLMPIMSLPKAFQNRKLEVIVIPAEEHQHTQKKAEIKSIIQSLVGVIPDTGLTLSELREERLRKYEATD